MVSHYETIRRLYIEKLSGVISEADSDFLAHWLASDAMAQEAWQALEEERAKIGADGFFNSLEPVYALKQVKEHVATKNPLLLQTKWYYVAVAALLVVGIFVSRVHERPVPMEFPVAAVNSNGVQLVTQDGQAINLDILEGRVSSVGDMEIRIVGRELQSLQSESVVMSTLVVPPKLSYRAVLPDGSKVWLNSDSRLHFPSRFDGTSREVSLEGEGYFEVTTDKEKPFIVHAGGTAVEVLGTRFNISSYKQEPVRTALVEGSVKVYAEQETPVTLHPGFMTEFDDGALKQTSFDPMEAMAWMDGIYYFNNSPLDQLALVINRWYGLSVILEDSRLARHRISGLMEREHLAYFLSDLQASTGIMHRIENETLTFYRK